MCLAQIMPVTRVAIRVINKTNPDEGKFDLVVTGLASACKMCFACKLLMSLQKDLEGEWESRGLNLPYVP